MRERPAAELRRWGASEGGITEQLALAEACVEASRAEYVVPVLSLAYRRFRTNLLEPLLAESVARQKINSCFPAVSRIPVRMRNILSIAFCVLAFRLGPCLRIHIYQLELMHVRYSYIGSIVEWICSGDVVWRFIIR